MQSHRKDSGSYLSRLRASSVVNVNPKLTDQKKKSSVAIQTEGLSPYFIHPRCSFGTASMDDIKVQYQKTLEFLNKCHDFMNGVLGGGSRTFDGDSTVHKPFEFRVPEVPNYFSVLEMYLGQCKTSSSEGNNFDLKVQNKLKRTPNRTNEAVFELPRNMGDGPIYYKQPQPMIDCETSAINEKAMRSNDNDTMQKVKASLPSRTDVPKSDLKAFSTTFEEILKTCNEFENKSIEYLLKQDVPLNEPPPFPKNVGPKKDAFALGHFEQGDEEQDLTLENLKPQTKEIPNARPKGFNLLEYALKNCKPISEESNSRPTSDLTSNKSLLSGCLPNILVNIQEIVANTNRPLAILNQAHQCQSPKRVNEMFQNISREDNNPIEANELEDSEELIKFIEYDDSLSENCDLELSSSESVILTDEEFQKRIIDNSNACTKENFSFKWTEEAEKKVKNGFTVETEPEIPVKSNPLKLNEKDKSLADEKVLRTIGLFTEQGDIRPGVISILEEKQRMNLTQNSAKNVKFRSQRKFDLEVRFNNNIKLTDTSEESLAGNSAISRQNMAAVTGSGGSSVDNISTCSTISESDILNA